MVNAPPRVSTCTGESSRCCTTPATTAAQAPVPHESVSPAPRSQTRDAMAIAYLHVPGVHALRETRMALEPRPLSRHRRLLDIRHYLYRVRVPHGDDGHCHSLTVEGERFHCAVYRPPHVHAHLAIVL